ncbi:ABC transporter permease [Acidocella sp.]|uniref:ABC transporter permease n=1 Tax=Acidocella sp. TaxID=50710 RepID=UPI003D0080BE
MTALGTASSLFLVAAGLTVIFGVTRVVNFAHGSLYMLGAYVGWVVLSHLPQTVPAFVLGCLLTAVFIGLLGVGIEMFVLRRLYKVPELYQLLATFGIVLIAGNVVQLLWGARVVTLPRAPWMQETIPVSGQLFPLYSLVMMIVGPVVLLLLWLLFTRTRWGALVRAATEDREMVGALGIRQNILFTTVFGLGAALAGLSGALSLPQVAATSQMALSAVSDAFVIVVIGGLGSVAGAFLASLLIAVLETFGAIVIPQYVMVAVFAVMAVVLVLKPNGLLGRAGCGGRGVGDVPRLVVGADGLVIGLGAAAFVAACLVPVFDTGYVLSVMQDALIAMLFAASLHFVMGPGGMPSFGHAAWFGLGAYGAALTASAWNLPMSEAIPAGVVVAGVCAALVGVFMIRLSGIYLAMLTFAFAQVIWALATQMTALTGGDNGILNLWPDSIFESAAGFYALVLVLSVGGVLLLRRILFSPFGFALRATRDAPARASASGIPVGLVRHAAFTISGAFAALAGGLFAFAKGSVFPTYVSVSHSVDALIVVLLGGIQTLAAPVVGALVYTGLRDYLQAATNVWPMLLGISIILMVSLFPQGIGGAAEHWRARLGAAAGKRKG